MNLTGRPIYAKQAADIPGIRASARGEPCTLCLPCCTGDPQTTVFAHVRQMSHAGMSRKPPDWWGVYACAACHREQERLTSSELCGWDDLVRALYLTQARLWAKGLIQSGRQT